MLAGSLGTNAHGSLAINLLFSNGSTSLTLATGFTGNVSIRVYATVTSASASSTPPSSGTTSVASGSAPTPTGTYHDGIQFAYYSVLSSLPTSTAIGGQIAGHSLNATTGFAASGSQTGTLYDVNGDGVTDVGSTILGSPANLQDPTDWAKPRAANAIWDDYHADTGNTDSNGNELYTYYGSPNIVISGNTVSFLVQTLVFKVSTAVAAGQAVKFSPIVPSGSLSGGLVPANWWEGSPDENQQNNTQTPSNNTYSAGSAVQLVGPAAVGGDTNKIVFLSANSGGTVYGSKLGTLTFPAGSGNGSYPEQQLTGLSNSVGYAEVKTFSPSTDPEYYALKLSTSGSLATIATDINNDGSGVTASVLTGTGPFAYLYNQGYSILLTGTALSADQTLAFDFGAETNVSGVTVTAIAAVPEPASVGLLLGASSLLLGRRRKTA